VVAWNDFSDDCRVVGWAVDIYPLYATEVITATACPLDYDCQVPYSLVYTTIYPTGYTTYIAPVEPTAPVYSSPTYSIYYPSQTAEVPIYFTGGAGAPVEVKRAGMGLLAILALFLAL
jgi:hypothetical protein